MTHFFVYCVLHLIFIALLLSLRSTTYLCCFAMAF